MIKREDSGNIIMTIIIVGIYVAVFALLGPHMLESFLESVNHVFFGPNANWLSISIILFFFLLPSMFAYPTSSFWHVVFFNIVIGWEPFGYACALFYSMYANFKHECDRLEKEENR